MLNWGHKVYCVIVPHGGAFVNHIDVYKRQHQIQLAFERLTQNKTVMMIAHRLSTIQDADLILVFKEGQIAEMCIRDRGKTASQVETQ